MTTLTRSRERAAATTAARSQDFRADIQGLRAIAVGLVLLYHARVPGISGGFVGVDVFFVISGFLITTHLLSSLVRDGNVSFGEFYARRMRRILPASFATVILTTFASALLPPVQFASALKDAAATVLYVPNVLFAFRGVDYLADKTPSPFQHFWSLGIEEQFYILWPILLVLTFVAFRRSRRALASMLVVVATGSLIASITLTHQSPSFSFFLLPTRAWELAFGGIVGLIILSGKFVPTAGLWASLVAWVGLAGIIASAILLNDTTPFPGSAALLPVMSTALVILGGHNRSAYGPGLLLNRPGFQFIGLISYSLYLVHWPILIITERILTNGGRLDLLWTISLAIISVPIGWAMYRFVEVPFRRAPQLVKRKSRFTIIVGLLASVVLAATAFGSNAAVASIPLSSGKIAPPVNDRMLPEGTSFVPADLKPALQDAANDNPIVYPDGCHLDVPTTEVKSKCVYGATNSDQVVVLFGDSHAAQWFPALNAAAKSEGFRLESYTKSSCPSVSVTGLLDGEVYATCDTWRDAVVSYIAEAKPDVVVLSNYGRTDAADMVRSGNSAWGEGLEKTVRELSSSTKVVVLADTPHFAEAPSVCLSIHLDSAAKCAGDRKESVNSALTRVEKAATKASGGTFVDLTDSICNTATCPAIIGNMLVYRDNHHLSATFSKYLEPEVWTALKKFIDG